MKSVWIVRKLYQKVSYMEKKIGKLDFCFKVELSDHYEVVIKYKRKFIVDMNKKI